MTETEPDTTVDSAIDLDDVIEARIAAALDAHVANYGHAGDIDLDVLAEKVAERLDLDDGGDTAGGGWGTSTFGDGPFGASA